MKFIYRILMVVTVLLPLSVAANQLQRVEQIGLSDKRFNLEAHFSQRVDAPVVRRSSDPLVHEFLLLGTASDYAEGTLDVGRHPLLDSVSIERQREDLLVQVRTKQPVEHLLSRSDKVMVLVFVAADPANAKTAQAAPRQAPAQEPAKQPTAAVEPEQVAQVTTRSAQPVANFSTQVTDINFMRGLDDSGRLSIAVSDQVEHQVQARGESLELTLYDVTLPDDLLYVLDVSQFATPIANIETFREQDDVRIVLRGKAPFVHQLEQVGAQLVLTLRDRAALMAEQAGANDSQPISLNFQDVPVRQLLQILADENNLNLVASESVTGNITLRLENVPWERALATILRVRGLDKRIDGNILIVAPSDELADREAAQLEASQRLAELAPLTSAYIQVNYAKASEIAGILRTDSSDLLSSRGAVTVDDRTNTLLVRDTERQIEIVEQMVRALDVPVKQVIIEARMVTVRDNISDELGIMWGLSNPEVAPDGIVPAGTGTDTSGFYNVNLPIANPAATFGFQVAKLSDGRLLDLELSALERENKGEIIASPRITTANQKSAYIEQGTEIPYVESASSGATSVQFKKAVLGLEVTPQITPDNRVILDLVITQNTRGDTVSTPTGPAVSIDTQEIGTQVLVENGETIVLGGIYQQQILNDISKVPLLGDIPYVGVLFRNESQINEKRELLIFVTPRIVTEMP